MSCARTAGRPGPIAAAGAWLALLCIAAGSALSYDPYAAGFEQARSLAQEGRHGEAAAVLEPLREAYPDDYALALELGWLHFRAGQPEAAARHYRRASALSEGSQEARLGLAWSLLELGEHDEAERLLRALLAESPDLMRAREGLEVVRRESRARAALRPAYVHYAGHPHRRSGWSIGVGVDAPLGRGAVVAGTFRFARFSNAAPLAAAAGGATMPGRRRRPGVAGGGSAAVSSYDQQELHLSGGLRRRHWSALAHFAYVHDEGEFEDDLFAVGLSGRIRRLGDLWLEASATFYPDDVFLRLSPAWKLELGRGFYLRPGGGLQWVDGRRVLGNGFVEIGLAGARGALFLGGKGGPERRPTYLLVPLVSNLVDELEWGVWTGASLRLGEPVELRIGYELAGLETATLTGRRRSRMHVIGGALGLSF